MKKLYLFFLLFIFAFSLKAQQYVPTSENLRARKEFSDMKFGIFIHWGIYSMFGQGEWYLHNAKLNPQEYAKAASGFFPARFDASEWVAAIKDSGAKYITFTSRHHDGFSMWNTAQSGYDIVDSTPYGKDIIAQLADECHKQGIMLNLYYSHIDWTREDYPQGRTARTKYRDPAKANWDSYYNFMNNQLTELLTNYGKIGVIWFDGFWDHDMDTVPFDWQLDYQYDLIHRLQPSCLVGNNHHVNVHQGEDIQIFERDVPGENKAGYSGDMDISNLPLETCQTMNGMWGYKVADQNYKSLDDLIRLLVKTSGMGANLLLNIGPQPSGELPAVALERLKGMGEWLKVNGEAIYGTVAGDIKPQSWGVTTRKDDVLYVHILDKNISSLYLPLDFNIKSITALSGDTKIKYEKTKNGVILNFYEPLDGPDYIIKIIEKK